MRYRVRLDDRAQHRADVELTLSSDGAAPTGGAAQQPAQGAAAGQAPGVDLWMPVWTPGAYELRTWGRNVTLRSASDGSGHALRVTRTGPSTFHVAAGVGPITVAYRVYAAHFTDDGSVLDDAHALLNGSSLFLAVRGHERERHEVRVVLPPGWRAASALVEESGALAAASYEDLIDAPIECGRFNDATFHAAGREFRLILDGNAIPDKLPRDVARLVEAETRMMGAPPFSRYVVIVHLSDAPGRVAALEHAASTSILMPSSTLADHDGYDELLYVVAHELFHAWNARRLRPAELVPYDLSRMQTSRALWITEGVTEYYAHRAMLLSKRWTRALWLERTSDEAARALAAAAVGGSVEEAAELTWQPPDDNAADWDAYYARGHLIALATDAAIRAASDGKHSLDDVMRALLDQATRAGGVLPVDSEVLARACDRVAPGVGARVIAWARGGDEARALAPALAEVGLALGSDATTARTSAGFVAQPDGGALRVVALAPDGAASLAGLRAGDRITALDGAPPPVDYVVQIARRKPFTPLRLDVTRGREHLSLRLDLTRAHEPEGKLELTAASPRATRLREQLLSP